MALVRGIPSAADHTALGERAEALERAYPIVSRVELAVDRREGLHPTQRVILSSDSLTVYGDDRLTRRQQLVPRDELIALVTPPLAALLADSRAAITRRDPGAGDPLRFYSRLIGKDLLKCVRGGILRRGDRYARSIDRIADQALAHFPEHAATIATLRACYTSPTGDRTALLRLLDDAARLP